jgi:methionine-rich copper-binding protein CopC
MLEPQEADGRCFGMTVLPALRMTLAISAALVGSCAAQPLSAPANQQRTESILVSSRPAAGSTVRGPIDALDLHFNPAARLDEIAVNGPDGLMPVKVTAVGEVADYSIPLAALGPGTYAVNWRATSGGRNYQGNFQFTVK